MKATDQPDTFSMHTTQTLLSDGDILDLYEWEYRDASGVLWAGVDYGADDAAGMAANHGYSKGHSLTLRASEDDVFDPSRVEGSHFVID